LVTSTAPSGVCLPIRLASAPADGAIGERTHDLLAQIR
jgi:hypothetical protein